MTDTRIRNWKPFAERWGIVDDVQRVTVWSLGTDPATISSIYELESDGHVHLTEGRTPDEFMDDGVWPPDQPSPIMPSEGVDFLRGILLLGRTDSYVSYEPFPPLTKSRSEVE
ncbi:MAG: hypothetical protein WCB51_11050 [Candidatus Dormiibacterota bacterium]